MQRKMNRRDWLLLGLLAAAVALFIPLMGMPGAEAARVEIWVDGERIASHPLAEDARIPVETPWGHNTVVIADGSVRVESADCPGQECVAMGAASSAGRSIICLPHRLSILLVGDGEGVDIVAS